MTTTTDWVDGHFVAGDVALDFANTVYRRRPELGADLLTDVAALTTWLTRTHLLASADAAPESVLDDARALRALLWTVFDAAEDGDAIPTHAVAGLLDAARQDIATVTVNADGSLAALDAAGAVAVLALRAVGLVLDPPPQGVRACPRCGWFFIDSSRGRRRRWCSMRTCGNRAKAARHRSSQL